VKIKTTKVFCLYKDGKRLAWDEKQTAEKPGRACRLSRTLAGRKYPGFALQTFQEAYGKWFTEKERENEMPKN
jgi:hypothetical protein